MKIILHGATNGSNFGDYLFADIFWRKLIDCNKCGKNIFFEFPKYGIGSFFRKELGYMYEQTINDVMDADMLVYFSGGYFGQMTTSIRESLTRFIRFMLIGMLFVLRKKPILVLGVGGGPIDNKLLSRVICSVINHSTVVTVRDEETANYFKNYGVRKEMRVVSDTAQVITTDWLPPLDELVQKSMEGIFGEKKIIFLHFLGSDRRDRLFFQKIIQPLNSFLARHEEYGIIIGYDVVNSNLNRRLNIRTKLACKAVYCYNYQQPWQLCSVLNKVDMIITPKLHVGIVGATLSKSVISLPLHSEKVKRYYKQIGSPERCVSLQEATPKIIEDMLERFHDKKIILSEAIIQAANKSLDILEEVCKHYNVREVKQ